jgi:uridine phosphorylase
VKSGVNITADSFYSGQGRIDSNFSDYNETIVESIREKYPRVASMEMESFMLLHLAKCSKKPVHATAAAIVVANRRSADVVDGETLDHCEAAGATALLNAIIQFKM